MPHSYRRLLASCDEQLAPMASANAQTVRLSEWSSCSATQASEVNPWRLAGSGAKEVRDFYGVSSTRGSCSTCRSSPMSTMRPRRLPRFKMRASTGTAAILVAHGSLLARFPEEVNRPEVPGAVVTAPVTLLTAHVCRTPRIERTGCAQIIGMWCALDPRSPGMSISCALPIPEPEIRRHTDYETITRIGRSAIDVWLWRKPGASEGSGFDDARGTRR